MGALRIAAAVAVVTALSALLVFGLVSKAPDRTIDDAIARGEPAPMPSFDLEVLDAGDLGGTLGRRLGPALRDGRLTDEELAGVPTILNIWASWCEPCREEAPVLTSAWRRARPRGVLFLGVDIQDVRAEARAFLDEFGVDYLNVRDGTDAVAEDFGTTGIPETFAIDARGRVVRHAVGTVDAADVQAMLRAVAP